MKKIIRIVAVLMCLTGFFTPAMQAQVNGDTPVADYTAPKDYEIGGLKVTGANFSDENALLSIAGFKVGDKVRIPGGDIPRAIKNLWKLRLFTDVQIYKEKTIGDVVFLEIYVQERPRLSRHSFTGVKKVDHDDLNDEVNKFLSKGGIVTENIKVNAANGINEYYVGKGFLDVATNVKEYPDTLRTNSVRLEFVIDKGDRVKVQDITFSGNTIKDKKLRKRFDNTKRKRRLFASSKFIKEDYEADKQALINYYNTIGFRDAKVMSDSLWRNEKGHMLVHLNLSEGNQYYFRDITFKGNSIYEEEQLLTVLGINTGDVYNQELLDTRLSFSQDGRDVSCLYMDNGYLFFRVDPVETSIDNDSIDLEIRIFEGPQATIDKVVIAGNDRTHEHVIRRELRTLPGEKFSRSDIIRSQREIINLGYFNPESLGINTPVNQQRGTVDIEYTVEEKPSDQLELSAGWGGAGRGVIGTLGVSFNNFSIRNIFKKESWSPLPQGDGQRLSVRAQTNGRFFQSYNMSFTEPWLGGKKPNSFSVSGFYTILSNGLDKETDGYGAFKVLGASVSLGTRLKWPDDNFVSSTALNFQNLSLDEDYSRNGGVFRTAENENVRRGRFNNFSITQTIARSTVNNPLFPQEGSKISLSLQITPPYSLFKEDGFFRLTDAEKTEIKDALTTEAMDDAAVNVERDLPVAIMDEENARRFRYLEYHKWRFNGEWYSKLAGKLTLKVGAKIGMIGFYNRTIGTSPFERFQLGGDGLNNQTFGQFVGTDIISIRGYEPNEIEANLVAGGGSQPVPTPVFNKFTVEVRYPLSLNPNSTIFVLAFAEGGNAYRTIKEYNPFELKRSAGMGLRVFLPMFGMLGFDYGIGFDKTNVNPGDKFFSRYGNFNVILGFEPE